MVKLTVVINTVPEGYIGYIKEVPGANTQGDSIEEVYANLQEALSLVVLANYELSQQSPSNQKQLDDNGNS